VTNPKKREGLLFKVAVAWLKAADSPNTFNNGLAWAADGQRFYASGAGIDDRVYAYTSNGDQYVPEAPPLHSARSHLTLPHLPIYDGGLLKGTSSSVS